MRFTKIFFTLSMTTFSARAQLVSPTALLTAGTEYRTIDSRHYRLRFPKDREPEARDFLGRAEYRLGVVEGLTHRKLGTQFNLFLTERRFQNAYVMPGYVGSDDNSTLPFHLIIPYFNYAGFDGGVYDVFVHEFAHYFQYSLNDGGGFRRIFGPILPFDMLIVPSWVWEGYAVNTETDDRTFRGRLKPSLNQAMIHATLDERGDGLTPWDFSALNKDWAYSGGANYVVGSLMLRYLTETYGTERVVSFLKEAGSWNWSSDFHGAFGKGFRELVADMNVWFAEQPRRKRPSEQKTLADLGAARFHSLARNRDGSKLVTIASFEDDEPRVLTLDAKTGRVVGDSAWERVLPQFLSPALQPPTDLQLLDDDKTLAFLSYRPSRDGIAVNAVLAHYDLTDGSTEIVADVPDALTATWSKDGARAWLVRRAVKDGRTHLELWSFTTADRKLDRVRALDGLVTVAGLARSPDDRRLAFAGSRAGESWNVYVMADGGEPRVIDAAISQELDPQWSDDGRRLYYMSDRSERFNVVSREVDSPENSLCSHTNVPYLTSVFAVSPDGGIFHDNRTGRLSALDLSRNSADCAGRVTVGAEAANSAPIPSDPSSFANDESFEESAWRTFIPTTRLALPYFGSTSSGSNQEYLYGASFLFGGESPYKKVSWLLIGQLDGRPHQNTADLIVSSTAPAPFITSARLQTKTGFFDDAYDRTEPRYNIASLALTYPFYNHSFLGEISYRDTKYAPSVGGFSVGHFFSASVGALKAAGPKRALSLSNRFTMFPESMGTDDPMGILRLDQNIALPLGLAKDHAVRLGATELLIDRRSGAKTGYIAGPRADYRVDESVRDHRRTPDMTEVGIRLRGFDKALLYGNRALAFDGSYDIPLFSADSGTMHLWNRMWLNPSFTNLTVGPFFNSATFLDQSGPAGNWHSAAGVQARFSVALVDFLPLSVELYAARRLTDDRKWEQGALLFGTIAL